MSLCRELAALDRHAHVPKLAAYLTNHAVWLTETGRRGQAVPVSEEAVSLSRELAALDRDAHLPGLANSLNTHAAVLARTGRRAKVVPVSEEAVNLYEELAELNRNAYLPDYARSLSLLGRLLLDSGRFKDSFSALIKAIRWVGGAARLSPRPVAACARHHAPGLRHRSWKS